jgi:hypothetical protein
LSAAALATLACAAPAADSVTSSESIERRVDALFAERTGADAPGCAVGIYRDGEMSYAQFADLTMRPVGPGEGSVRGVVFVRVGS